MPGANPPPYSLILLFLNGAQARYQAAASTEESLLKKTPKIIKSVHPTSMEYVKHSQIEGETHPKYMRPIR
jgi:hypothetical protein